ncbi:hypothetical protein Bca52824_019548 [Brassica carinata]|uniref:F-box domain-containing protein n=1 Tax=Brassica carinata TaxID=52824 RepID=A0A8X7VRR6_BRACI|nr:hypothetical protein Bca52824_019548 [Brassica carinata]
MESLTDYLWTMVLARLPIKIFTGFKLVSKQWKSILESPFFRNLFMSVHQNSASSSWSLMGGVYIGPEVVAHYQCDTWGLNGRVEAYSDVGLILIQANPKVKAISTLYVANPVLIHAKKSTVKEKRFLYVANPVSQECMEICIDPLPSWCETDEDLWTGDGVLFGYKVILIDKFYFQGNSISLNCNLHWLAGNSDNDEAVLSMDFYATSTGSDRCRVTPFPDLEKFTKLRRACTPCQVFLMYMNIHFSEGWQLMSEISPSYFWGKEQEHLLSINLHNGKFVIYSNQLESRSDGLTMTHVNDLRAMISLKSPTEMKYVEQAYLLPFVLPQWLYRIPNTVRRGIS